MTPHIASKIQDSVEGAPDLPTIDDNTIASQAPCVTPLNYARSMALWDSEVQVRISDMTEEGEITLCPGSLDLHKLRATPTLCYYDYFELKNIGEAFGFPEADFGNLRNDVHPYFRHISKVPGSKHGLRLASLYFIHGLFLPFWRALLCVNRVWLAQESTKFGGDLFKICCKATPLSKLEVDWTRKGLTDAARYLVKVDMLLLTGDWAQTGPSSYEPASHGNDATLSVASSIIVLEEDVAVRLHPLNSSDIEERKRQSFLLAHCISHEVVHAVWRYSRPTKGLIEDDQNITGDANVRQETLKYLDPFFEDQPQAELGFAFTFFHYGGDFVCCEDSKSENDAGLKIAKYGLSLLTGQQCHYLGDSSTNKVREAIDEEWQFSRRGPRKFVTEYVVPMDFVDKHFTEKFWTEEVKKGFEALQFEKKFGCRRLNDC